jgi:hypothetical protein
VRPARARRLGVHLLPRRLRQHGRPPVNTRKATKNTRTHT